MYLKCNVFRGDHVESVHQVNAVIVDSSGEILYSFGDPHYKTYIRSSLKPFQASVCIESGAAEEYNFNDKELAIMCASHNGEDIHTSTVSGMLEKIGIDHSFYECGVHPPFDKGTRASHIERGIEFSPLHNNCSGKHAGMLAIAQHAGWDHSGYISKAHPVQTKIKSALERYSGKSDYTFGVDGCSAPTPFMSLKNIATMFQKFASGGDPCLSRLYDSMVSNPYLVAGRNRFDTDFMETMRGRAVTKVGGESVRGLGIRQKNGSVLGIALKVLDGAQRANGAATMALLKKIGLLEENEISDLSNYDSIELLNHRKKIIGKIEATVGGP